MPQFVLDTSGKARVGATKNFPNGVTINWNDLDAFTQGYIEALFFTENSPAFTSDEWHGEECQAALEAGTSDGSLPGDAGFADLHETALATIVEECAAFQRENADLLAQAYGHNFPARVIGDGTLPDSHRPAWDYDEAAAGRDFWYTRNGHGVGFWDRGLGEVGDKLSDACRYSEVYVSFEADGKVHL
ncbi:hypothetical protein HOU03_gp146 [Caulobacter phage CcrSC]|uniref:Uncharacterized protein n=1 Tax=Caulobacter phage CcrSC TaxID=2283272 RepID=A0A385EGM8_9CAUD|nr:hypothetical protein HOU03_gp040 [Caulobacter phage CcrSC]YP_009810752.1 hypothetical protein HOU03_gp146 [Caulobacter phage CcrSC]AXQ69622.1 hypothetical protein CcrSC_gp040 [Caulobacter phage CcrSC]AXQ70122.1 hypothetical protein CcrSC_gp540 [Caulobacter phage CcrSC]